MREPIAALSGGEKSRLQLLRLMIGGPNCLLLDEPTNHLDIAATEVLEAALDQFDGTVLTISHDRYFLDRICTRIFEMADGEVYEYPGGYSDWAAAKARAAAARREVCGPAGRGRYPATRAAGSEEAPGQPRLPATRPGVLSALY